MTVPYLERILSNRLPHFRRIGECGVVTLGPKRSNKRRLKLILLSIISAIVVSMATYYVIFIMPFSTPSAPRDFMSSSTDDEVTLSWTNHLSSGSSPVTNYRIYRGNASGNETFLTQAGTVSWYSDLSPSGGTYYYLISALNGAG